MTLSTNNRSESLIGIAGDVIDLLQMNCNEQKTPGRNKLEGNVHPEESLISCDSGNPGGGIRTHDQGIMSPRL